MLHRHFNHSPLITMSTVRNFRRPLWRRTVFRPSWLITYYWPVEGVHLSSPLVFHTLHTRSRYLLHSDKIVIRSCIPCHEGASSTTSSAYTNSQAYHQCDILSCSYLFCTTATVYIGKTNMVIEVHLVWTTYGKVNINNTILREVVIWT